MQMAAMMIAAFDDEAARGKAIAAAVEKGIVVQYAGMLSAMRGKDPVGNPRHVALFVGRTPADGLVFMQNGAASCSQL